MLRRWLAAWTIGAALACAAPLGAQDLTLEQQFERVAGLRPEVATAFFDALRRNVGRDERAAACAMVAYPLEQPSGPVPDAAACVKAYDQIFTIAVRRAIGRQAFDQVFVDEMGVMLGNGELWYGGHCASGPCAELSNLHITRIAPDASGLVPPKGKVLLSCGASGQKIRIAADGRGGSSLSVWLPGRISGEPDRFFPSGTMTTAAECSARSWTFTDPARTYLITDLPCDAYLNPPPMGVVGRVTLSTPASPGVPLWCAE